MTISADTQRRIRDVVVRTVKTFVAAVAATYPLSRWLTISGQKLPQVWAFLLPPVIAGVTAVINTGLHAMEMSKNAKQQRAADALIALGAAIDKQVQLKLPRAVQDVLNNLAMSPPVGVPASAPAPASPPPYLPSSSPSPEHVQV